MHKYQDNKIYILGISFPLWISSLKSAEAPINVDFTACAMEDDVGL